MEDAEVVATLSLSLVPGVGSQRLRQLVGAFGSAQAALAAPHVRLASLHGIGPAAATAIKAATPADGERVLAQLAALGGGPACCCRGKPTFRRSSKRSTTRPPCCTSGATCRC